MAKSPSQQLAMIVDGVQPHCDEPLESAMICSRPGAMGTTLLGAISGVDGFVRGNGMPPTVIVAVGPSSVYVFRYKPRGFKITVKDGSEVARWPRDQMRVEASEPGAMTSQFSITTADGNEFPFEVTTAMGAKDAYELFLAALTRS